jgi:predicted DNA-binding protein (MmcQ/YjbR family)
MHRDDVRALCAGMTAAEEGFPFGDEVAVFKVGGKMFALVPVAGDPGTVTLKCDPEWAVQLRRRYAAVEPGYHTNKRHWNTIVLDGTVPAAELEEMIWHSYELVVDGLPRRERERIRPTGRG